MVFQWPYRDLARGSYKGPCRIYFGFQGDGLETSSGSFYKLGVGSRALGLKIRQVWR